MSAIFEKEIKASLLKNNTKLSLMIAQTPGPTLAEIVERKTNADIRNFIAGMFCGGIDSRIARMAQSQVIREVVTLPEFAVARDYWHELDAMVSQFPGALIVIAGVGFWNEDELLAWKNVSPDREFGFNAKAGFGSPYRTFNCGCCWIHPERGGTRRVVFLKNYNEQRIEAPMVPSLVNGNYILCLSFDDINLYPLICADVTCYSEEKPVDVVLQHLLQRGDGKRHLLATVAYEKTPGHPLWQRGIARAVQKQAGAPPLIMTIANAAAGDDAYGCTDDWRNLTGVYVATDYMREQNPYPCISCLDSDRNIFGALVRTGEAALFAGEVSWDFGSGGYRDLWRPRLRSLADDSGYLREPEMGDQDRDELLHSLLSQRQRLSSQSMVERNQKAAMEGVIGFIRTATTRAARNLARSMLYGLFPDQRGQVAAERHRVREKRLQGAKAIGALKISPGTEWRQEGKYVGQLKFSNIDILVWASPTQGNPAIRRDIQRWLTEVSSHPPLLIFADGVGGTFVQGVVTAGVGGRVSPDRRTDISAPPPDRRKGNFTANKIVRVACLKDLRLIENSFEEQDIAHSVRRLLDLQVAEMRGFL